jgi:hypothetical protein
VKPLPAARCALGVITLELALAIALAGCGPSTGPNIKSSQRGNTKDIGGVRQEQAFEEIEAPQLPPYPQDSALLEFIPRRNSSFHFYVDRDSLSIGADRVIRYSVLARSPSGAVSASYEGMRCKTSEYKVYALGTDAAQWARAREVQWRKIPRTSADFRFALYKDYFCDIEAIAGRNEKDLIAKLKGNPLGNFTDKYR